MPVILWSAAHCKLVKSRGQQTTVCRPVFFMAGELRMAFRFLTGSLVKYSLSLYIYIERESYWLYILSYVHHIHIHIFMYVYMRKTICGPQSLKLLLSLYRKFYWPWCRGLDCLDGSEGCYIAGISVYGIAFMASGWVPSKSMRDRTLVSKVAGSVEIAFPVLPSWELRAYSNIQDGSYKYLMYMGYYLN